MLTFVDAISLAGDRKKQNDDAFGWLGDRAWVIDGATDLHDAPLTGWASDASWIANLASSQFYGSEGSALWQTIRDASHVAAQAFENCLAGRQFERWQSPISSLLMIEETATGVRGLDLGDCRFFALDATGAVHIKGGPEGARDAEAAAAAAQTDADKPLLQRTNTIDLLRRSRASLNRPGYQWTFGLDPSCADHARLWAFDLPKPAHLLLMSDGFAVLVDQYEAYDAAGLVRAVLEKGMHQLCAELRAIEVADTLGAKHPRFKASDDATAVLLRLT